MPQVNNKIFTRHISAMRRALPRRKFLKALGASALVGPSWLRARAHAGARDEEQRLNIVLIVADDQRFDTIAALGNPVIQTPNFDALVRDGVAFTEARCMGATQGAVCIPSRASMHTGRMLFQVPDDMGPFETIGQTLQQVGYNAGGFGKWHNKPISYARSFNHGANIFFGGMGRQFNMPVHNFSPTGEYAKPHIVANKFSSELFTDPAVAFIERQKSADQPFFCYVAYTSPHDPRTPPAPFNTMYDRATMPLPANFLPAHPFDNGELINRDERLAPFPRTPEDTRKQLCDYYGMVTSMDAQVGRILSVLKTTGQDENTIVIYTGDHGLAIGSHGLFGKQNVYEHSAKIPLIVSGPGLPRSKSFDALVYGFDIFPTICDLLKIKAPPSVQGKSLVPIIHGHEKVVRESSFHAYIHQNPDRVADTQHAVRDERWKLIRYDVKGERRVQIFDLKDDPDEVRDLAADSAAQRELPRLNELLTHWQKVTAEPVFGPTAQP
jgi:arylsulfatase A-like enzyme